MSAISLKSITGITSITTPAGVDNQLTLHTNDTTQRVKVTQSGIEVVGVATFQDLDVDGHTNLDNVSVAGVTTFSGRIDTDRIIAEISSSTVPTAKFTNSGTGNQLELYGSATSTILIKATNNNGTPKLQLRDNYNRDNFISVTDSGDNLVLAVDEGNQGADSTMQFRVDGSEKARINSSGRLGLGTNNPDTTLTVQSGGDAQMSLKNSSGTTKAYVGTAGAFGSAGTDDLRIRSDSSNIVFGFSGAEKLRITSAGDVGIGTFGTFKVQVPGSSGIGFTNTSGSYGYFMPYNGATGNMEFGLNWPGGSTESIIFKVSNYERLRINSGGVLNLPAGIGPQLRFENQHSVTTDAVISTFDDATGTLLCLGSNFYMNSSGAETRYNTSEESAGIVINRNGSMNFLTGGTGATATGRFGIRSDGKVLIDNNDGTLTIGGDNVYDSAKINLMVGSSSQTSATTEATALVIHDLNSRRNGTEGTGSWKSKITFRSTQINGNSASEGASIVHDITYNNYSSTKMRSDLVFKTRGDAQTASSDAATEKLRIRHDGLVGINENQPDSHLHVNSGTENDVATFQSTDAYAHIYIKDNSTHATGTYFGVQGNDFRWITHNDTTSAERLRLTKTGSIQHRDGSGISYFNGASEYIFGSSTSSPSSGGSEANVQIHSYKTRAHFSINGYMNNAGGPMAQFVSSRAGTPGTLGAKCISNDYLGETRYFGDNGTNGSTLAHGATIWARAKSTPADGDTVIAGEINFSCGDASAGSVQDKMKIQGADGKIKFGPGLVHQLHSQAFAMYPDNGGNHVTRLTFTGLQYGTYIAQIGYYNAAGQGYGGGMFHVSGYQTASYTYNVHEIVRWDNAGNSAISAVSKYNSSWVIDITNSHGSYQGAGEVSVYGDAQVTCTITYHT